MYAKGKFSTGLLYLGSNYKTNKEVKIMAILLHVGKPIEPSNYIWGFQKKKARNLPRSFKFFVLAIS
jgi:hypothetical protein